MEKTFTEAKNLLDKLQGLINETSETHQYVHTAEIAEISRKLQAMKLNDEFFLKDLSDSQQRTLNLAFIIANVH